MLQCSLSFCFVPKTLVPYSLAGTPVKDEIVSKLKDHQTADGLAHPTKKGNHILPLQVLLLLSSIALHDATSLKLFPTGWLFWGGRLERGARPGAQR